MFVVFLFHSYRELPSRFVMETFRIEILALAPVIFVAPSASVWSDLLTEPVNTTQIKKYTIIHLLCE